MASIQASIQLQDQMSSVLNNITASMNIMLSSFSAAQTASNTAMDATAFQAAQNEITNASAALVQYQEELERVKKAPVPTPPVPQVPPAPSWQSVSAAPVFMNSGADRFEAEIQSANQMAQQLYQSQQQISAQARNMSVTPPGMLNDVAMVSNRVQSLGNRIQELNNIPVELRTGQTNNEIEALRGKLSQALGVQENLSTAMSQMDISAANAAYKQLNAVIDSTERDIRSNMAAQEQFNQSMKNGQSAAAGLDGKIKSIALSAAAAFSVQKIIALSDSATQTTARLNLMNDGLQSTEELNQKIFASAQRARAPYMETAGAIAKMGLNAGNAFNSNDELIAFMEQVNKQFVIGGASAQEQSNAMVQLSQSMAAGALRGEELNSILDAAPGIARTIEQNMGWAEGSIKQYAEKGAVSAQVVKASLLNMAQETNDKFNSMPMTFGQVITTVQNTLLQTFWPMIQMIGKGASFINEHWDVIAPIFYGIAAGILGAGAAWGIYTIYQLIATGAAEAFFAALLSNPLFWIAIAIAAVVAVIYKWVQSVGGLKIAWLICVNAVKTYMDNLKLAFMLVGISITDNLNNMVYGFESFKAGVLNALGEMKVKGLTVIQDFINGAIDRINKLIEMVNSIGGTSIKLIGHVEFAADAAIEEESKKQQRAVDLAAQKDKNAAAIALMREEYDRAEKAADDSRMQRQADIAKAQNDSAKSAAEQDNAYREPINAIAGNTDAMASTMDVLDEDLKYMRDAAEQEIINRFTLAELKVDVKNSNTLTKKTDFDDMGRFLSEFTSSFVASAAEGGHL